MLPPLLLSFAVVAAPAEVQPGVAYQGPKALRISSEGLTFRVAKGWTAQLAPAGDSMVFSAAPKPDVIFGAASRSSEAEIRQTLGNPIPTGLGIVLQPTGKVQKRGGKLMNGYTAGAYRGYAVARRNKDGRTVAFIGLAPASNQKGLRAAVNSLASSVRFASLKSARSARSARSAGGKAPTGAVAKSLAGRKLHRFYGDYGYREHQIMVLCRNGRFFWNMEAGGVTRGVASGASNSQGQGSWSVSGQQLKLRWDQGGERTYRVEHRSGKLFLNGKKWLRESGGC